MVSLNDLQMLKELVIEEDAKRTCPHLHAYR